MFSLIPSSKPSWLAWLNSKFKALMALLGTIRIALSCLGSGKTEELLDCAASELLGDACLCEVNHYYISVIEIILLQK